MVYPDIVVLCIEIRQLREPEQHIRGFQRTIAMEILLNNEIIDAFRFQSIGDRLRDQNGQHDGYRIGQRVCQLKHDDSQGHGGALQAWSAYANTEMIDDEL